MSTIQEITVFFFKSTQVRTTNPNFTAEIGIESLGIQLEDKLVQWFSHVRQN